MTMRLLEVLKHGDIGSTRVIVTKGLLYLLFFLLCYCAIFIGLTNPSRSPYIFNERVRTNRNKVGRHSWSSPYTYVCVDNDHCERVLKSGKNSVGVPVEVCWLSCGKYGALWPFPTGTAELGNKSVPFSSHSVYMTKSLGGSAAVEEIYQYTIKSFNHRLEELSSSITPNVERSKPTTTPGVENEGTILEISAAIEDLHTSAITLEIKEEYSLKIKSAKTGKECHIAVFLKASTIFGLRHGFETLSQLIAFNDRIKMLEIIDSANIVDKPTYSYRGLMIDTARNFIPVSRLKETVKAMSYNKLNMLHLHLTDSNAFSFYSRSLPQMATYGAYDEEKIYYPEEIMDLIKFSTVHGVKVIPELDAPAHAGNGWQWGPQEGLGDLAVCVNSEPWHNYCGQPPCGQLNPVNPNTLNVLETLYEDFLELFDKDLFHMGGDEVYLSCWMTIPEVQKMLSYTTEFLDVWGTFQVKAYERLKKASEKLGASRNPTAILWTSGLTTRDQGLKYLDKDKYIIQVWETGYSQQVTTLFNKGYKMIFSNVDALYLDMGFGSWLGSEHDYKYKPWQVFYGNDLKKIEKSKTSEKNLHEKNTGKVLGGEATLWSEKVNEHNMGMKLWPRGAALAENLWSAPSTLNKTVYARLVHHTNRMISRGVQADQLQPESCYKLTGHCDDLDHPLYFP